MKLITIIFILTSLSAFAQSQNTPDTTKKIITRNLQQDINNLIPTGEITVDIMDVVTVSARRQELQAKFMQALKANPDWFMRQLNIAKTTGKKISYNPKVGMTKAEWKEFIKLMDNMSDMQAVSSGTAKVTISKSNDIISFKAEGKLSCLNSTTIDIKNNVVKVFNYTLTPTDTICVTNADNVFKSAWRGYEWKFSEPANAQLPATKNALAHFSMKLYEFTLALFDKTGKSYIEISGSEMTEGKQTVKYQIPIVF